MLELSGVAISRAWKTVLRFFQSSKSAVETKLRSALELGPDVHKPVRMRIGQWRQQSRVIHGEDRRSGSDAQSDREQDRGGKNGIRSQAATGSTEVWQAIPPCTVLQAYHSQSTRRAARIPVLL